MDRNKNTHCKYRGDAYDVCRARLGSCRRSCISGVKILITSFVILAAGILLFSCVIR